MASFFDYGTTPDMQQAMADSYATMAAKHLAVQPRVNLRDAMQAQLQQQQQAQRLALLTRRNDIAATQGAGRLALEERRLGLERAKYDYESGQAPFTTALGVVSGGLGLYRGYRDLARADASEQRQRVLDAQNAANIESQRRSAATLADILRRHTGMVNRLVPLADTSTDF